MGVLATPFGGEVGKRNRDQCPAEAESEQVGRGLGAAAHFVNRRDDSIDDIILDALVLELGPGIDPRHDEHRPPLVDQPFDQALVGREVDHVVTVHQRRHVKHRRFRDLGGGWRILDQLEQFVLEHHLARRRGDGLALDERALVGAAADDTLAAHRVLDEILEPVDQIGAVGLLHPLHHVGVGEGEIGRGDGVEILVEQEAAHRLGAIVAVAQRHHLAQLGRGEQISIAHRSIIRIVLPVGRVEPPVARLLACLAGQRLGPEIAPLGRGGNLHLEQVLRPHGKPHRRLAGGARDGERVERKRRLAAHYWRVSSRPTIMRMTWLVPSRIEWTRRSRQKRSIG